jgi:hypothetical protein
VQPVVGITASQSSAGEPASDQSEVSLDRGSVVSTWLSLCACDPDDVP